MMIDGIPEENIYFIYIDDYKTDKNVKEEEPMGFFARIVSFRERKKFGFGLSRFRSHCWHARKNYGMFNTNYRLRLEYAMRCISSLSIPSFSMHTLPQVFTGEKADQCFHSSERSQTNKKDKRFDTSDFFNHQNPYGRGFREFAAHMVLNLMVWRRIELGRDTKVRIILVLDEANFISRDMWKYLEEGNCLGLLRDRGKTEVYIKFIKPKISGGDLDSCFLQLVDSEVWALGRFMRKVINDGKSLAEIYTDSKGEVLKATILRGLIDKLDGDLNYLVRKYLNFVLEHVSCGLHLDYRWSLNKHGKIADEYF